MAPLVQNKYNLCRSVLVNLSNIVVGPFQALHFTRHQSSERKKASVSQEEQFETMRTSGTSIF